VHGSRGGAACWTGCGTAPPSCSSPCDREPGEGGERGSPLSAVKSLVWDQGHRRLATTIPPGFKLMEARGFVETHKKSFKYIKLIMIAFNFSKIVITKRQIILKSQVQVHQLVNKSDIFHNTI